MKGFIYCITNATNGKRYIGQTTQPVKYRFRQHLTMRLVPRQVINKAISKHGGEAFSVETLEEYDLPKDELQNVLNERETHFINQYNTFIDDGFGYNCDHGGSTHAMLGRKHRPDSIKKNSESNKQYWKTHVNPRKGKTHTAEANEKNRLAHVGKKSTSTTKKKQSIAHSGARHHNYGKTTSEEVKQKIRDGVARYYHLLSAK